MRCRRPPDRVQRSVRCPGQMRRSWGGKVAAVGVDLCDEEASNGGRTTSRAGSALGGGARTMSLIKNSPVPGEHRAGSGRQGPGFRGGRAHRVVPCRPPRSRPAGCRTGRPFKIGSRTKERAVQLADLLLNPFQLVGHGVCVIHLECCLYA